MPASKVHQFKIRLNLLNFFFRRQEIIGFLPKLIEFSDFPIFVIKKADKDSQILIWDLMILLLGQKNTDIAELLLKNRDVHKPYDNVNNNKYGKVSPNEDSKLIGDAHKEVMKDSDNDDNASYVSEVDQETDEDFVKVVNYLINYRVRNLKV